MIRPALVAIDRREDEELVRRLATDKDFYSLLAQDPTSVLAEYDIELPPMEVPRDVVLPPRSEMVEALRVISGNHLAPARASWPPRAKFWPAMRGSVHAAAH